MINSDTYCEMVSHERNSYSTVKPSKWTPTYVQHDDERYLFNARGQTRQHAEVYGPNYLIHCYNNISLYLYNGCLFFWVWNDKCELYNATYHHTLPHLVGKTQMQNRIEPTQNPLHFPLHNTLKQCLPNFFARGLLLALKNNHGSSHPCSRKYSVRMIGTQN
jgi:hypothetical protein